MKTIQTIKITIVFDVITLNNADVCFYCKNDISLILGTLK